MGERDGKYLICTSFNYAIYLLVNTIKATHAGSVQLSCRLK